MTEPIEPIEDIAPVVVPPKETKPPKGMIRVWLGEDAGEPTLIPEGDKAFTLILPHLGAWHHKSDKPNGEWVYGR